MTPEQFAETYEKARYESMLSRRWEDLRPTERQVRTDTALAALEASGLADVLRAGRETAVRAEVAEGLLAQRDAELARRAAEHREREAALEAELAAARAEHEADLEHLRAEHAAELDQVRGEHEADLEHLRAEHAAELDEVRGEHEAEIDRRRALRDGALAVRHDARADQSAIAVA